MPNQQANTRYQVPSRRCPDVIGESRTLRRLFVYARRCPLVSRFSGGSRIYGVVSVRLCSPALMSELVSGDQKLPL
jgi:hypothetical protein